VLLGSPVMFPLPIGKPLIGGFKLIVVPGLLGLDLPSPALSMASRGHPSRPIAGQTCA
jgi:hypothetical protein